MYSDRVETLQFYLLRINRLGAWHNSSRRKTILGEYVVRKVKSRLHFSVAHYNVQTVSQICHKALQIYFPILEFARKRPMSQYILAISISSTIFVPPCICHNEIVLSAVLSAFRLLQTLYGQYTINICKKHQVPLFCVHFLVFH